MKPKTETENAELSLYQIQMEEQREAELKTIELNERKHRINNEWCDYMALIFEKYRDEFIKTEVTLNGITLEIFNRNGIDTAGKGVYDCFDNIINQDRHIEDYMQKQRGKYSVEMPY